MDNTTRGYQHCGNWKCLNRPHNKLGRRKNSWKPQKDKTKNRSPAGPFPCEPMTELPRVKPKKLEMEMKASLMKLTQTAHLYTKLDNMKN